jgi:hypothetical protein
MGHPAGKIAKRFWTLCAEVEQLRPSRGQVLHAARISFMAMMACLNDRP